MTTLDSTAVALCRAIDAGDRAALGMLADWALERGNSIADGLVALRDLGKWPCFAGNELHYFYSHEQAAHLDRDTQIESLLPDEWIRRCPVLKNPDVGRGSCHTPSAAILEAAAAWRP